MLDLEAYRWSLADPGRQTLQDALDLLAECERLQSENERLCEAVITMGESGEFGEGKPESLATTPHEAWPAVESAVDWLAERLNADVHMIRAATLHPMDAGTDHEWLQARWPATMFMEGDVSVSWVQLDDLGQDLWGHCDNKLSFADVEIMPDADGLLLTFTMAAAVERANRR